MLRFWETQTRDPFQDDDHVKLSPLFYADDGRLAGFDWELAPCLVEPKVCRAGALRLSLIKKEGVRDSSIKKCMG